ncbi:MAG: hypothetical protein U0996_13265 [Planctomycetaceae bacterium]
MKGFSYALWILGFREYYCPHCFEIRVRPAWWLKWLVAPFRYLWQALFR